MPDRGAALPDRGPAAYIAEFVGTLILVFMITSVLALYLATEGQAQFGTDFVVIGLVHGLVLFVLVQTLFGASGAHFNPAVTAAMLVTRKIKPIDAAIYVLVQLSGGVAGALLTKGLLLDEGRSGNYGAMQVSDLLGGPFQGAIIEAIGTFLLVFAIVAVVSRLGAGADRTGAAFTIGMTLTFVLMVFGPLTGAGVNPARWFGPALVGSEFGDVWPYVVGPLVGAVVAALFHAGVIEREEKALAGSGSTASPGP